MKNLFPGPNFVIVLDHGSIHHHDEIQGMFTKNAVCVIQLPPYLPIFLILMNGVFHLTKAKTFVDLRC
ncbi:hypothetical protein CROQUDRAFT_562433 [Cronartium quercuum f. sp. fusiforme G11]|uniref:Tc1-like transposase DDE domain-containing protein n=1 Tax=Cronartium quercuum f. sp. fusiforme G11 TaxID=708437 RepID=A0A9P6TAX5_9BASI|nr:hypothetical protein CROQUDRAFT_562433 [Cronartium quercuum f. sp. fusiforme G11]